jgi:RNA polymerase sigma-70 factor (ECF subfamily)
MGAMSRSAAQILDEYLVASAKAGDRAAVQLLVRRWQKKLIAHAWRLTGDAEAARDAAQEGWIEILRGIGRLEDERAFPAWAYRIVSRRCARQIGTAVRRRELAEAALAEPLPQDAQEPGAGLESERLRAAVRALPEDQRAAVALFHFEEMSVAEVAVALDVPVGTVKTRLMHARRKLRAALEGDE